MCEQGPSANTDQSQTNFILILHTFLPLRRSMARCCNIRCGSKGGHSPYKGPKLTESCLSDADPPRPGTPLRSQIACGSRRRSGGQNLFPGGERLGAISEGPDQTAG